MRDGGQLRYAFHESLRATYLLPVIRMKLADEIASLDQRCMTDVMAAHGEIFDIHKRTGNLSKCLNHGDDLISVRRGGVLIGYALITGTMNSGFIITSLQIFPEGSAIYRGLILRDLMIRLMRGFSSCPNDVMICVETHPKNNPSISLLTKLGFHPTLSAKEDRLRFNQKLGVLRNVLRDRYNICIQP